MKSALYPHQQRALGELYTSIHSGKRRPLVYSPTGSGKTILGASIVERALAKGSRIAFTVPSIALVDQTVEKFWHEGIRDVGVIQADHRSTDWSKPVQVCSVDTLARRGAYPKVDVVIVDECHVVKKGLLHWMENVAPDKIFIGLSATPWRKGIGRVFDDLIVASTIEELQEAGLLSRTHTFAPSHPDLDGVRTTAGEFNGADLARKADQKALVGDVVETWLAKANDQPTICFAVDCAHARLLQERFKDAGVSSAYVDHTMDQAERRSVEQSFRNGDVRVMCNVDCLGLGFDVPGIGCISYARPTKSLVRWVQNIGRGLRIHDGKDACIVLDHSDTTLRLGFVEDAEVGALDDDGKLTRKKSEDEDRERLPKACPSCAFVKPAGTRECPQCGFIPEVQTAARSVGGELVELDEAKRKAIREKRRKSNQFTMAEKLTVYRMLLGYARSHGYKSGWVAHKYRAFFSVWPKGFGDPSPLTPDADMLSWIKSQQIRFAKRRHA